MNQQATAREDLKGREEDEAAVDADPTVATAEAAPADPATTHDAKDEDGGEGEGGFVINDRRFWAQHEAADDSAEAARKPSYVEELERQVADKDERLQATLRQYKEALDEFEGAKARLRRDIGKEIETGKRAILADLLDVVDNLERAIEAAGKKPEADPSSLLAGVIMVRDQFLLKLQNLGVQRLEALDQPFDPAHFEAVSMVPVTDAAQDGKVVGVVRSCYLIGEETLRHGMVAVGKAQ